MMTSATAVAQRKLTHAEYERFLPMVRRIAMRLARRVPRHIAVADLMSSGWVGLMEAFRRADSDLLQGQEFEAYASYRVKGAMLDYLRSSDHGARQARNASRRVTRAIARVTRALGRPPEESEIAAAMGLTLEDYRSTLSNLSRAGMARLELVDIDEVDAPDPESGPDDLASTRLMGEAVQLAIEALPVRLQQLLSLYYVEGCTLREVGEVLGVSESRVCQLHAEAMHRLRAAIGRE